MIRNLSRLITSSLSKHQQKKHFCLRCLNGFSTQDMLTQHQEICLEHKLQTHVYPNPGDKMKFKNVEKLHDIPFVVYADFECFVKPIEGPDKDSNQSFTMKYQDHEPSGFCYTIKCMDENIYPTKTVLKTASYDGEDMGKKFVDMLSEDMKPIYEILKNPKPMSMSNSDKKQHMRAENCYACGTKFGTKRINKQSKKEEKVTKCKDHCHITGKYRGAACDKCNLRMMVPMFVLIVFDNLEGYDSHLFVKSLGLTEGDINCIPKTDEKYISFTKKIPMDTYKDVRSDGSVVEKTIHLEMRFIDSVKFTFKSLDSLVSTLRKINLKH